MPGPVSSTAASLSLHAQRPTLGEAASRNALVSSSMPWDLAESSFSRCHTRAPNDVEGAWVGALPTVRVAVAMTGASPNGCDHRPPYM